MTSPVIETWVSLALPALTIQHYVHGTWRWINQIIQAMKEQTINSMVHLFVEGTLTVILMLFLHVDMDGELTNQVRVGPILNLFPPRPIPGAMLGIPGNFIPSNVLPENDGKL